MRSRRERTAKRTRTFKDSGQYNLVVIKECEFEELRKQKPELDAFVNEREPTFYRRTRHKTLLKEQEILRAVYEGEIFGLAVVDIEVSDKWTGTFTHELPPREFYSEYCPLFNNKDVGYQDIGPYMQNCIKLQQLEEKRKRILHRLQAEAAAAGRQLDPALLKRELDKIR